MLNNLLYIILLILGFPSGLYLAKICKEEIKKWRKRMILISVVCFILSIVMLISGFEYKLAFAIGLLFIVITFLTIVWKSHST
jgi:accessory gene regulator protein AgrB